jgi:glucose-6-phosphate isomerase
MSSASQLITYNPANVYLPQHGISPDDLKSLAPKLEAARTETLLDCELWHSGAAVPPEKQPLDARFIDWPEKLLGEYQANREQSQLGKLLATAKRLNENVDRVIVLGIGGSYMGAKAIMEACCHPFHNELPRSERGGYARMYFEGNNLDNDALQGLLDLIGHGRKTTGLEDRWGVLAISKSGGTLETAAATRIFAKSLLESCGGDAKRMAELFVPVTGYKDSKLLELSKAFGCQSVFEIPDGIGGRFSVLTAVGLLPAALLGLDIVKMLEGAAAMNAAFRAQPVQSNPVLDYVGICHLLEAKRGCVTRILSTWGKGLEYAGLWYDQLLAESLGKKERGALPLTIVNTRDLHSRGQQHQEGRRDKLITNVIVDSVKRDRVAIEKSQHDQDGLNSLAGKTYPQIMAAAIGGTNQAYEEDNRPTADFHLPRLNEHTLGQFFQLLMLATVVEGRLIGINPYGQPGVEAYKRNMKKLLS